MLKNFRLIATVFVFAASGFGAFAQTNETENYKEVLLNGKPAQLNLVTGEITYINGEVAKNRAAKKIKDSLLATRTEIKTNLIKDMVYNSESTQDSVIQDPEVANSEAKKEIVVISETDSLTTNSDVVTETSLVSHSDSEKVVDSADANTSDFHMVKEGETLYALSKRYNTSLGQLMAANDLETTLIKEGETLRVRNFKSSETVSETVWIVSKGDTLYNIAKRNNTTVEDLKDLNELSDNLIIVGQKLQVNQNSTLSKK
ncbi:LysM peptidoglycan-binding domain-containing protein [Psychroserpens mesophilus]|uniref:LysM peptidoglycan-binding domain-containing protein n=1 Tax=Psychroserpens mesophilus TaxID=325473 RepID=UPI003F499F19